MAFVTCRFTSFPNEIAIYGILRMHKKDDKNIVSDHEKW